MNSNELTISANSMANLIIIGHSGAGKSTLASLLGLQTNIHIVEIGHLVKAEAALHETVALDYANDRFLAGDYLYFVKKIPILYNTKPLIIVGPRLPEELNFLRERYAPCITIGLHASNSLRGIRRTHGSLPPGGSVWLHQRDAVERAWGLPKAMELVDYSFDGREKPYYLQLKALLAWKGYSHSRIPLPELTLDNVSVSKYYYSIQTNP